MSIPDNFMTVPEAAKEIGVDPSTVHKMIKRGILTARPIVSRASVEAVKKERESKAKQPATKQQPLPQPLLMGTWTTPVVESSPMPLISRKETTFIHKEPDLPFSDKLQMKSALNDLRQTLDRLERKLNEQ